jgi:ketosteroid isomerase-like protein
VAHPNEELLRIGYQAVIENGITAVRDMFDDQIRWHVAGRHRVAGDYHGKRGVEDFWQKLVDHSDGTFHMEVHDVLANDNHAVALIKDRGRPKGKPWENNSIHVWHIRNGKLTEFWRHPADPYIDDDLWS